MKCRIVLLVFIPLLIFAKDNIFSNIPPASIEVINIDPQPCNSSCLFKLSKQDKIFSFVARFNENIVDDEELHSIMEAYSREVGIYYKLKFDPIGKSVEVALLMPKKIIGKYSTTTIDTILAYLFSREIDFRFKIFDSFNEDYQLLKEAVDEINSENFNFVIAILSNKDSIEALDSIDIPIYIPTMTNKDVNARSNVIFGGIDYQAQIDALLKQANDGIIISYNDDSQLGSYLGNIVRSLGREVAVDEVVTNKIAANFSRNIKSLQEIISGSNIFLNTPVVKSGLILSQLDLSNKRPNKILSTQVNYNTSLLSLVRGNDTSNLIIANSNSETNQKLIEYGLLLSSDLQYDWVNYSTALGIDLFLSNMSNDIDRYFVEDFSNNQAKYNINLYTIRNGVFVKLDSVK